MIGIGVFAFAILYIWLSRLLITKLPNLASTKRSKKVVRIVVWFIVLWYPVIDPAISYVAYRAYAFQHTGVHIYRTVEDVDKVFLDGLYPVSVAIRENKNFFNYSAKDRGDMAYDVVEYVGPGGVLYKEVFNSGRSGRVVINTIESNYTVKYFNVIETRYLCSYKCVISSRNGEIIGSWQDVWWYGGGPMYNTIETSSHKVYATSLKGTLSLAQFIHKVLRPQVTNSIAELEERHGN
jgi:hypothetical protein